MRDTHRYVRISLFSILVLFFIPPMLTSFLYPISSDNCTLMDVFRSGKLPGSPQSDTVAILFMLALFFIYSSALKYEVAYWSFERWLVVIPQYMTAEDNFIVLALGNIRAHIRVFFVYPTMSFFCAYILVLFLSC